MFEFISALSHCLRCILKKNKAQLKLKDNIVCTIYTYNTKSIEFVSIESNKNDKKKIYKFFQTI